jgi:hypothetical protein
MAYHVSNPEYAISVGPLQHQSPSRALLVYRMATTPPRIQFAKAVIFHRLSASHQLLPESPPIPMQDAEELHIFVRGLVILSI